jgi:hypothetical protein
MKNQRGEVTFLFLVVAIVWSIAVIDSVKKGATCDDKCRIAAVITTATK